MRGATFIPSCRLLVGRPLGRQGDVQVPHRGVAGRQSDDVLKRLAWLMATRGVPGHIRSDNGAEFTARAVRDWLGRVGVKTL